LDLIPLGDELIPAGFQSGYLVRSGSKLRARWKNDVRAGSGFLNRSDRWSFCLTAARMAAEQERR
jgi:hypothetical protein